MEIHTLGMATNTLRPRVRLFAAIALLLASLLALGLSPAEERGNSGSAGGVHAFLWDRGKMTDLGTLGGANSMALAINEHGQVVGASQTATGYALRAFLWHESVMKELPTLGGASSKAVAINQRGQVVGESETSDGKWHAVLWEKDKVRDLGTLGLPFSTAMKINDRGQVVGTASNASGSETHPFLWQKGVMRALGDLRGTALDLNNRGQVVGQAILANGTGRAFLWDRGTLTILESLGGPFDNAFAINERGQVVGVSINADDSEAHGVLWEKGRIRDLSLGPGKAIAINDRGQVLCQGQSAAKDGVRLFLWDQGNITDLGVRSEVADPYGLTENGQVVGGPNLTFPSDPSRRTVAQGFLWRRGVAIELGTLGGSGSTPRALNERGQVVGMSDR